jgi:PD-(D/E)XK nuclease superfamily
MPRTLTVIQPNQTRPAPKGFACKIMGNVTFEQCLNHALAEQGNPPCKASYETLAGIAHKATKADPELETIFNANPYTFRVSDLTQPCVRSSVLARYYAVEYLDLESEYKMVRGEFFHTWNEQFAPPNTVRERRLVATLSVSLTGFSEPLTVTITGKPDAYTDYTDSEGAVTRVLKDFKSQERIYLSDSYTAQLNVYNWLLWKSGEFPADKLLVDMRSMAEFDTKPVEVWEMAEVEEWLVAQIQPRLIALLAVESDIPTESELPEKLDLTDRSVAWACRYCSYSTYCYPDGVPGAGNIQTAKRVANFASKRAYNAALGDLEPATDSQKVFISKLAEERDFTADSLEGFCHKYFSCGLDGLTKAQASKAIDLLKKGQLV